MLYGTLNVADIVRWVGLTKYVMYWKRGAFDSAHAYTLNCDKISESPDSVHARISRY